MIDGKLLYWHNSQRENQYVLAKIVTLSRAEIRALLTARRRAQRSK